MVVDELSVNSDNCAQSSRRPTHTLPIHPSIYKTIVVNTQLETIEKPPNKHPTTCRQYTFTALILSRITCVISVLGGHVSNSAKAAT